MDLYLLLLSCCIFNILTSSCAALPFQCWKELRSWIIILSEILFPEITVIHNNLPKSQIKLLLVLYSKWMKHFMFWNPSQKLVVGGDGVQNLGFWQHGSSPNWSLWQRNLFTMLRENVIGWKWHFPFAVWVYRYMSLYWTLSKPKRILKLLYLYIYLLNDSTYVYVTIKTLIRWFKM